MLDAKSKQKENRRYLQRRHKEGPRKEGAKDLTKDRLLEGKTLGYNSSGKAYGTRNRQNEYTC